MANSEAQRPTAQVIPLRQVPQIAGLEVTEISASEFLAAVNGPLMRDVPHSRGELVVSQGAPIPDAWQLLPLA